MEAGNVGFFGNCCSRKLQWKCFWKSTQGGNTFLHNEKKKGEKRGEIKTLLTVIIFFQLIASNLLGELEFDFK